MFIAAHNLVKYMQSGLLIAGVVLVLLPGKLLAQQNQIIRNGEATQPIIFPGTGCIYKWVIDQPIGYKQTDAGTGIPSFTAVNNGTTPIVAHINAVPVSTGFAYIANSISDNVTVIDAATHSFVKNIPVDNLPSGVAVSPDGTKVYVANNNKTGIGAQIGSVTVIDALTNTASPLITVGKNPVGIAVSPDGSRVYVTNQHSDFISVIDAASNTVIRAISGVADALAITVSADGQKLFVTADGENAGKFYVVQVSDGQLIYTLPLGLKPSGIVATPDSKSVYITNNYSNIVSVIDIESRTIQSIAVNNAPYGITISPDGKTVYVANSGDESISIINTSDNKVAANISIPGHPFGLSVSPNGEELYISCSAPDKAVVMNTLTRTISPAIPVGDIPIFTGNFVSAGIGCSSFPVNFTITVNPSPSVKASGGITNMATNYGAASSSKRFDVTGNNLIDGILVTPPAGFEVSADDITFTNTLTIGAAGNVALTPVFIRLKATDAVKSDYGGNIVLTSTGVTAVNVAVPVSLVAKAALIITADHKSKVSGDTNPVLTYTYLGFVNGEGTDDLTTLPMISTTATSLSPIGTYPITITGVSADNYEATYINSELDVLSGAIVAPTAFTPNDDGINDTWEIKYLNSYTNCTVQVIGRNGSSVFRSVGYAVVWNGKQNGVSLPTGTYYYIINLNNNTRPITGYVAIIK